MAAISTFAALSVILSVTSQLGMAQYPTGMFPSSSIRRVPTSSVQTPGLPSSGAGAGAGAGVGAGAAVWGANLMYPGGSMMSPGANMMYPGGSMMSPGASMMSLGANMMYPGFPFPQANTAPAPRMLTCQAFGERNNRLAVTIKDMSQADMGMGMGMSAFPGLAMSPLHGAFGMLGAGLGAGLKALGMNAGGLSVDVQLTLDMDVPNAYLAVTEYSGSALAGCDAASYGPILSDSSSPIAPGFAGMQMFGGLPGFGMGANIMSSQQQMNAAGIVKMVDIQRDSVQNIQATMAPEFTIDSLAGRGFVVCNTIAYDFDMNPVCDNPMPLCCGLTRSTSQVSLPGNS